MDCKVVFSSSRFASSLSHSLGLSFSSSLGLEEPRQLENSQLVDKRSSFFRVYTACTVYTVCLLAALDPVSLIPPLSRPATRL